MKNNKTLFTVGIIAGIILILIAIGGFFAGRYNQMVTYDQGVKNQWAKVQSAYQRRSDLIPNLVNTVKGYAEHEQQTLMGVTEARAAATGVNLSADELTPENMAKFQQAQQQLSGALSRLLVTVEKYPDLKANQNFLELQSQLEGTENRINVERNRFNDAVALYNTYIMRFPNNLIAGWFGFTAKGFFEGSQEAQQTPKVEF